MLRSCRDSPPRRAKAKTEVMVEVKAELIATALSLQDRLSSDHQVPGSTNEVEAIAQKTVDISLIFLTFKDN
jgi:hypothetical protein